MKKSPGRKERRRLTKQNRTKDSGKKQFLNERKMFWLSRYMRHKPLNERAVKALALEKYRLQN